MDRPSLTTGTTIAYMAEVKEHPKVTSEPLYEFHGLEIYGVLKKAKKDGKDRVWIQIRQSNPKKFRVAASLNYARAVDVQFEKDK